VGRCWLGLVGEQLRLRTLDVSRVRQRAPSWGAPRLSNEIRPSRSTVDISSSDGRWETRARLLDRPSPGLSREPLFSASRHEASSLRRSAQFSTDCPIVEDGDSVIRMRGPGASVEEVDALG